MLVAEQMTVTRVNKQLAVRKAKVHFEQVTTGHNEGHQNGCFLVEHRAKQAAGNIASEVSVPWNSRVHQLTGEEFKSTTTHILPLRLQAICAISGDFRGERTGGERTIGSNKLAFDVEKIVDDS